VQRRSLSRSLRTASLAALAVVGLILAMFAAADAATAAVSCAPTAPGLPTAGVAGAFVPVTPTRVLDTREGIGADQAPVGADCVVQVDLSSVVPPSATGVAATVTTVNTPAIGFITTFACNSPRPNVSNVNTRTDSPVPNLVVAPVDSSRRLCLYSSVAADLVVDVTGYFASDGAQFHDVAPRRAIDTRVASSGALTDAQPAGSIVRVDLTADGVPANASAAAVNVTITDETAPGYATAFACGGAAPLASNVNYLAGEDRAAQAMVGLGAGALCVYVSSPAQVIVDLWGWYGGADGADIVPNAASRLVDTRIGTGGPARPIAAGEVRSFAVPQLGGGVRTAIVDVVATNATTGGYLTLYACGTVPPATSSVNYGLSRPAMNLVTVPVGVDGTVCVSSSGSADVIVDLLGFADNPGPLRSLSASPRPLTTSFTPTGRDYAMACVAGNNRVTVTAVGLPGSTISISGAVAPLQLSTVVDVTPNALVSIDISTDGGATDRYFIRCLPPDFPTLTTQRLGKVAAGWYLVTPGTFAPGAHYAMILDERGVPLWYRQAPVDPATNSSAIVDFKRLPSGALAWVPVLGVGFGVNPTGAYQVRNLSGVVTSTISAVGTPTDQHDMIELPNGDHVVFTYEIVPGVDLTSLGSGFGASESIASGNIQEISASDGSVVWEWKSVDHISVGESRHPLRGLDSNDPNVVDLEHLNSIDVAPNGDYIVSARHLDAVFRISRSTGKILWKLGGTPNVKDGATSLTVIGDPLGGPKGPHDARLHPDGSLTLFDNELGTSNATRAVQYQLDAGAGAGAGTATLVRSYASPDGTNIGTMGSVRITADRALVIGWGAGAPLVTQIDAGNRVALQIDGPAGGSYRAAYEPMGSFDRATLRSSSSG
jgi:hypothetical protein